MIRLSEALARLHCDDVIQPAYVREAFRLLQKSIIHVETEDVTFDNEEDEDMAALALTMTMRMERAVRQWNRNQSATLASTQTKSRNPNRRPSQVAAIRTDADE